MVIITGFDFFFASGRTISAFGCAPLAACCAAGVESVALDKKQTPKRQREGRQRKSESPVVFCGWALEGQGSGRRRVCVGGGGSSSFRCMP